MLIAIDCDECEGSFIYLYTFLLQFYDGFAAKVIEGEVGMGGHKRCWKVDVICVVVKLFFTSATETW